MHNPQKLDITDDKLTVIKGELSDYDTVRSAVENKDAVIWWVGIPMTLGHKEMNSLNGHKVLLQIMMENCCIG